MKLDISLGYFTKSKTQNMYSVRPVWSTVTLPTCCNVLGAVEAVETVGNVG